MGWLLNDGVNRDLYLGSEAVRLASFAYLLLPLGQDYYLLEYEYLEARFRLCLSVSLRFVQRL